MLFNYFFCLKLYKKTNFYHKRFSTNQFNIFILYSNYSGHFWITVNVLINLNNGEAWSWMEIITRGFHLQKNMENNGAIVWPFMVWLSLHFPCPKIVTEQFNNFLQWRQQILVFGISSMPIVWLSICVVLFNIYVTMYKWYACIWVIYKIITLNNICNNICSFWLKKKDLNS